LAAIAPPSRRRAPYGRPGAEAQQAAGTCSAPAAREASVRRRAGKGRRTAPARDGCHRT
jgi:hypothetical protein